MFQMHVGVPLGNRQGPYIPTHIMNQPGLTFRYHAARKRDAQSGGQVDLRFTRGGVSPGCNLYGPTCGVYDPICATEAQKKKMYGPIRGGTKSRLHGVSGRYDPTGATEAPKKKCTGRFVGGPSPDCMA